jgi:hypothetical protein
VPDSFWTVSLETVWKMAWRVLDRQYLVTLEGETEHFRPVFTTRYTLDLGAYSEFPDSFLEEVQHAYYGPTREEPLRSLPQVA